MSDYIYDQAWEQERARLAGLEAALDPGTIRLLERIGVTAGWTCLEVGGGGGSIASWLCARVGPSGRVVATDLDTRFLESLAHSNLEVRRHDVTVEGFEPKDYDLVHSRDVLEHLPAREVALERMVRAVRPGGWILVEDVDMGVGLHGLGGALDSPVELAALTTIFWETVIRFLSEAGVDPTFGRKLSGHLLELGLADVGADLRAHLVSGGSAEAQMFQLSIQHLQPRLIGTGMLHEEQISTLIRLLDDHATRVLMPPHIAAWGRRP